MTTTTNNSIPVVLDRSDLTVMSAKEFALASGAVNAAFSAAEAAYELTQDNLTVMLTEQIVRRVMADTPDASLLFVQVAAEYHYEADGTPIEECEGHHHRLAPTEVLDSEGQVLAEFDPLSPLTYLMERLTPMLGMEDQVLDIGAREWAIDCTNH